MPAIILKPGREKSLLKRHPWIFSGAVATVDDEVPDGGIADVVDSTGRFLARASVNRRSQIVGRVVTWSAAETIDDAFWGRQLARSIGARSAGAHAVRLVNAESDGMPGLIVDRYGDWLVLQALTLGADRAKRGIARLAAEIASSGGGAAVRGVWERSDVDVRAREGLGKEAGPLLGEEPPAEIEIEEQAAEGRLLRFGVDVRRGHKTGFYLDQRENRPRVAACCAGRDVLDLFGYTGGFAAHALAAGAHSVEMVDSSVEAIALAPRNLERNALAMRNVRFVRDNVFEYLRRAKAEGRRFGAVIADPPKLAKTQAHLDKATRAYKDLNLLSMQVLEPGGILATFSCSGLVSADLFRKVVFGASVDAGRDVQVLDRLGQPADHPVLLGLPEAEYLKGLVCRVE
jgi:23S rRNA (cytosine1962-C5)-methyltransferase